jgi:spore coat protein JB
MKISGARLKLLKEIMALEFSLIDLNLYLDTHPTDRRALTIYNEYTSRLNNMKREYENEFAPLTASFPSGCPWRWIENPWPWEIDYEMGGK